MRTGLLVASKVIGTAVGTLIAISSFSHGGANPPKSDPQRSIQFPDTAEYQTIAVDLHTHSVFSDGHVWPTIRIKEALADGLDAIAITEHLEWQPHLFDIPHPDRNRAFEEAQRAASGADLLVIPGAEITRGDQPGHMNAVFIEDANMLVRQREKPGYLPEHLFATRTEAEAFADEAASGAYQGAHSTEQAGEIKWAPFADVSTYENLIGYRAAIAVDARAVLDEAARQNAFVFWNHPGFATAREPLNEFHTQSVEAGVLHGIEVTNGRRYYENAHRLALEHDLTLIGTSDVHELIDWDYPRSEGAHRPVTLVLAKERTAESIRQAMLARRTVIWWETTLIGREAELTALLEASVRVVSSRYGGSNRLYVVLENHSDAELLLRSDSPMQMGRYADVITLPAHASRTIDIRADTQSANVELKFSVLNALLAPHQPAELRLQLNPDAPQQ